MKRILFFILLSFSMAPAQENFIKMMPAAGMPGTQNNIVSVWMKNSIPVRGVQLQIADTLRYLFADTAWTAQRTQGFSLAYNPQDFDGFLSLVLISSSKLIPADTGKILQINYSVSEQAPLGQVIDLIFKKVIITDENHKSIEFTWQNGKFVVSETAAVPNEGTPPMAREFALGQNFPNPFNPSTKIPFQLDRAGQTRMEILNVLGQRVRTVIEARLPAGSHIVSWDGLDENGLPAPAGVYFYRLVSGKHAEMRQLTLLR